MFSISVFDKDIKTDIFIYYRSVFTVAETLSPLSMERVLERIRRRFCLRGTRAEQAVLLKNKKRFHY